LPEGTGLVEASVGAVARFGLDAAAGAFVAACIASEEGVAVPAASTDWGRCEATRITVATTAEAAMAKGTFDTAKSLAARSDAPPAAEPATDARATFDASWVGAAPTAFAVSNPART